MIEEEIIYTWREFYHELPDGIISWSLITLVGLCLVFYPIFTQDVERPREEYEESKKEYI